MLRCSRILQYIKQKQKQWMILEKNSKDCFLQKERKNTKFDIEIVIKKYIIQKTVFECLLTSYWGYKDE